MLFGKQTQVSDPVHTSPEGQHQIGRIPMYMKTSVGCLPDLTQTTLFMPKGYKLYRIKIEMINRNSDM